MEFFWRPFQITTKCHTHNIHNGFCFSNDDSISLFDNICCFGPFRFLTMRYFKINHNFECFRGETWQKNSHFIKHIEFSRERARSYSFHAWIFIDEAINLLVFFLVLVVSFRLSVENWKLNVAKHKPMRERERNT